MTAWREYCQSRGVRRHCILETDFNVRAESPSVATCAGFAILGIDIVDQRPIFVPAHVTHVVLRIRRTLVVVNRPWSSNAAAYDRPPRPQFDVAHNGDVVVAGAFEPAYDDARRVKICRNEIGM